MAKIYTTLLYIIVLAFLSQAGFSQKIAPDFTLTSTSGIEYNLYSQLDSGKTVVLDFFSISCGSCGESVPELQKIWIENDSSGAKVWIWGIEISGANNHKIDSFLIHHGGSYPVFSTQANNWIISGEAYDINYAPQFCTVCPDKTMSFSALNEIRQRIEGCSQSSDMVINNARQVEIFYRTPYIIIEGVSEIRIPVKIFNTSGIMIMEVNLYGSGTKKIKFNPAQPGLYFIHTGFGKNCVTQKIMVL